MIAAGVPMGKGWIVASTQEVPMSIGSISAATGTPQSLAAAATSAASKAAVTDPRDTNKDGKVSAEEARQYALAHDSGKPSADAAPAKDAAPSANRVDLSA